LGSGSFRLLGAIFFAGDAGCGFSRAPLNLVNYYETPGGYQRGFCRECGSPILNRTAPNSKRAAQSPQSLSQYGIPLAVLDESPVRPECHVFVGSKAPWFEITDKLPQYAEYAPD
jgi:hypothetical protein